MKLVLTNFGIRFPRLVMVLVLLLAVVLASRFPLVHFDNDPENMLSEDEPVRVFHNRVKEKYALYDFVIVGIVNERHPDGVFNVSTLERIYDLTYRLLSLHRDDSGRPAVYLPPGESGESLERTLDLSPGNAWHRMLAWAFGHEPDRLFDENGESAIVGREVIGPSVVDNIKQEALGSLKIEYLMERPPSTREEALVVRDDAMANPLYAGTLVSEDEKAICLYLPIVEKTFSYNVANLVRALTADWDGDDRVYITGLPVAEDTFGVEMLVQMATSAPLAGLVIFVLLWLFFKRVRLIVPTLALAVVSIVYTMGLLIGLGYDVHIMSSMIAIFLMPIAVADSVHILSEFYDSYHRFRDKAETLRHVVGHLFKPMLYTSLTTIAGFASLATTPIPPVRVFGLFVAFGVAMAWLLTMVLIPAYIMLFVSEKSLETLAVPTGQGSRPETGLHRWLERLGAWSYRHWRLILGSSLLLLATAVYGITTIRVNDNPVKWFVPHHPIREADAVLNRHFGGTYTAYLTMSSPAGSVPDTTAAAEEIQREGEVRLAGPFPDAWKRFSEESTRIAASHPSLEPFFEELAGVARDLDVEIGESWRYLGDEINYLEPEGLTLASLTQTLNRVASADPDAVATLTARLAEGEALEGSALQERALEICDSLGGSFFGDFVLASRAAITAPAFKRPEVLRYLAKLQAEMATLDVVGKTSSAVDALKKAAYELRYQEPPERLSEPEKAEIAERNRANFAVPDSVPAVGQVFTQLEGMKKKDSLFHLVTRDYREANLWVQLKSGDNRDMQRVVSWVKVFLSENPPPAILETGWAGLTYINVVWQDKMVRGMLSALASSFAVVLLMVIVLFRSPRFGVLAMVPLSVTISMIYGVIGLIGKDYDMPVAVLSALTLGLSVDFAIHFLQRARETTRALGDWRLACPKMFKEPVMAISRNAITISVGFLPLLLAPLVPYRTVGFFMAAITAVSWAGTLFLLPALLTGMEPYFFGARKRVRASEDRVQEP